MSHWRRMLRLVVLLAVLLPWPGVTRADGLVDWWLTPDQQGQAAFDRADYAAAAERFADPERRAAAFFRAGDFESAAALYGRLPSAEAAYNRGNALVMLGRYEEAIASYDRALTDRAAWPEAEQNREIARIRMQRLAPPEDDAGGTGGQLGADEIVFDDSGRVNRSGTDVATEGGETLSQEELRATWLRRVENNPADFLRARFAYQLFREQQEGEGE